MKIPLVVVKCIVYNHAPYIRTCLDGIVNQKTNFPFVSIVHDDASTDGTIDIIREYAERYPDIIKPIFEEENKYSKSPFELRKIIDEACYSNNPKYIAMCEGDDYWTDPLKLQKQFDFMEAHPDYSLHFHNASYYNQQLGKVTGQFDRYSKDTTVPTETMIIEGGGFCPSCSLFYRADLMKGYPDFAKNYHIGDLPLQIYLAIKGKVFYSADNMSTYRIMVPGSWTERTYLKKEDRKKTLIKEYRRLLRSLAFLDNFDAFSDFKYHDAFAIRANANKSNHILYTGLRKRINMVTPRDRKEKILFWIVKSGLFPLKRKIDRTLR